MSALVPSVGVIAAALVVVGIVAAAPAGAAIVTLFCAISCVS